MLDKFEYRGMWWLPEKPEEQISGMLKFTPTEGATLDLDGSFQGPAGRNELLNPDIILGLSTDGKEITLNDCLGTHLSSHFPGSLSTSSFFAHRALVGAHFGRAEDILFRSLSISYTHLDEWLGISPFQLSEDREQVVVRYEKPQRIGPFNCDGWDISIDYQITYSGHSYAQTEATVKQRSYVRVEPPEGTRFDKCLEAYRRIEDFLAFAVQDPVSPSTIEGETEAKSITMPTSGTTFYPPIGVFFQPRYARTHSRQLMPFQMLFTYNDIADRFQSVLEKWLNIAVSLESVHQMYFGVVYNPSMYLEQRFLALAHALESYHARAVCNYEIPEAEHQKRVDAILGAAPDLYRDWLTEKLSHSNQPTLRKRLRELLGSLPAIVNSFMDKQILDNIVKSRNYLTHYDEALKGQAASGAQLFHLAEKLKLLVEMCLLKELGFSSDVIQNLLSRNERYRQKFSRWSSSI